MQGLMMNRPLTISMLMQHADRYHPNREIVSVGHYNRCHRYSYSDAFSRVRQLANVFSLLAVSAEAPVATLAWNDYRHLEIYYASSCSGFIFHAINPRLGIEQLSKIINHAANEIIFIDRQFVPLIERLAPILDKMPQIVVLSDKVNMPESDLLELLCYEILLEGESDQFDWPEFDENTASSLCYTSAVADDPQGVLSSHRATVLHAFAAVLPDAFNLSCQDVVLPDVPMFQTNAWGAVCSAVMVGAKLVLPGSERSSGKTLYELMQNESVTFALGTATAWRPLLAYLHINKLTLSSLRRIVVSGTSCSINVLQEFQQQHGVTTHHAWGMTEFNSLGVLNSPTEEWNELNAQQLPPQRAKQGRGLNGIEFQIVDAENQQQPWDGQAEGVLRARGYWVCSAYFKAVDKEQETEGWFDTGNRATIDELGFINIIDCPEDLIGSDTHGKRQND